MIIGTASAKEWKFIFMGIGYTTGIESELIAQELDSSDQISFIRKGIPGIQIFSGPHLDYHKPTDTPDKIDQNGLVKIAKVAKEIVMYLSEREEPMTFTGKLDSEKSGPIAPNKKPRASIGIMPDFAYSSIGVQVGMALKSSDGKDHVLKKGDIITHISGIKISDLKAYSSELKKYTPGQEVQISFLREGRENTIIVVMRSR